jgi:hypothetical protein
MISFNRLGKFGRLGNQLFQIAATIGAADRYRTVSKFPKWEYSDHFINQIDQTLNPAQIQHEYIEPAFHYTEPVCFGNTDLVGYFQSELYFKHCESLVREIFQFKPDLVDSVKINECEGRCSIHVRRTDYLSLSEYHPFAGISYYQQAIKLMKSFGITKFIIFSDDITWCKQNFDLDLDIIFSDQNSNIQDLSLMSRCSHHIIANSSFSWWGSWLNSNPEKRVIAPTNWFGPMNRSANTKDLYCQSWLKL